MPGDRTSQGLRIGLLQPHREWVSRYASACRDALEVEGGPELLSDLIRTTRLVGILPTIATLPLGSGLGPEETILLEAVVAICGQRTGRGAPTIAWAEGLVVAAPWRDCCGPRLPKLCPAIPRTSIHSTGWLGGPSVLVDRRRLRRPHRPTRGAHRRSLSRDAALSFLWPSRRRRGDNSLNQTVFQLRRTLDPAFRQRESPEYIIGYLLSQWRSNWTLVELT